MIEESRLCQAIARAERGEIDAALGGGLIKQRVARDGGGRSGGYRTMIAFRTETRSIFLYGFAKNERQNIGTDELDLLKKLARRFLSMTDAEIRKAIVEGELIEVGQDGEDETNLP
jgi:hypothetical protein